VLLTDVFFYQDEHGRGPVVEWLQGPKRGEFLKRTSSAPGGEKKPLSPIQNGIPMRKTPPMAKTKDVLQIIDRITGDDQELRDLIEEETLNAQLARMIHDARTRAGLTQQQLAELVGTKQPVIARLEDADYEGHSLAVLRRIAAALDMRVEIRIVPAQDRVAGSQRV